MLMTGLSLNDISHRYQDFEALHGVSLDVAAGKTLCLLGPSGCGKSTLLRIAAGLERTQRGTIKVQDRLVADGERGLHLPPERRNVGLMFQDYALFPHLSVWDNIHFGVRAKSQAQGRWIRKALRDVDMTDLDGRFPHALSGGQQQRVALLRALAPNPAVLLLDEPFSGLDEHLRQQVRHETAELLSSAKTATVVVTHDAQEAMFLADRIAVMREGKAVQVADSLAIYTNPSDPFVASLFGPVNQFKTQVRNGAAATPVGDVRAPAVLEGQQVMVVIRADAMELVPPEASAVSLQVRSSRCLGPTSVAYLQTVSASDDSSHPLIEVRLNNTELPEPGAIVGVRPARSGVFVYPVV